MDRATNRYRKARIEPGTGGMCRDCGHHVDDFHVQLSDPKAPVWCQACDVAGATCGAATKLATRAEERALARAVR
jgi:hypothetical protein